MVDWIVFYAESSIFRPIERYFEFLCQFLCYCVQWTCYRLQSKSITLRSFRYARAGTLAHQFCTSLVSVCRIFVHKIQNIMKSLQQSYFEACGDRSNKGLQKTSLMLIIEKKYPCKFLNISVHHQSKKNRRFIYL